jgi:SAM-dependent methyltransferase
MLKSILKKVIPGVSWQNPALNMLFKILDPIDYAVRKLNGLSYLPLYSIRVRSNGISHQFGGRTFYRFGCQLAEHLKMYASLNRQSRVLEIGCGCGRTAFALSAILDDGGFDGLDIEKKSIASCQQNKLFCRKKFRFHFLDVQNNEYNPTGSSRADSYKFPYADNEFDVIFLVSVFTHMLTNDVENYIAEISRMLKPGGVCMLTTFLMDKGRQSKGMSFPYKEMDHYFFDRVLPEVAVGYSAKFFITHFSSQGLVQIHDVLWGSWRNSSQVLSTSGFSQDILFFQKQITGRTS